MSLDPTRKHLRLAIAQQSAFHDGLKHGVNPKIPNGAAKPEKPALRQSKASRALSNPYFDNVDRNKGSSHVIEKQLKLAKKTQQHSVPISSFLDKDTSISKKQQKKKNLSLLFPTSNMHETSSILSKEYNNLVNGVKIAKVAKIRQKKTVKSVHDVTGQRSSKSPDQSRWI